MKFSDNKKEILEEISDLSLKQQVLELRSSYLNILEQNLEHLSHFKQQFKKIYSQCDPPLMRYLLANLGYIRYFSIEELKSGELDNIFHGFFVDNTILELYDAFISLPVNYFAFFVDNFGFNSDIFTGSPAYVNIIHVEKEPFETHKIHWRVMGYVHGLSVEDASFSKPTSDRRKVLHDLRDVIDLLKKWSDNAFSRKLLDKSLAIPILKNFLEQQKDPFLQQVLDNYENRVPIKVDPLRLAHKEITVYSGRVMDITKIERELKIVEIRLFLSDVRIVPYIKRRDGLSEGDIEFVVDQLEVHSLPSILNNKRLKVGDTISCYGKIESKYTFRTDLYLNTNSYDEYEIL